MNRIYLIFISLLFSIISMTTHGQQTAQSYRLTLDDVIQIAKEQSPQAIQARHTFRASYFSFMSYKATFLPKLTLTSRPTTWDKSIRTIQSVNDKGEVTTREARGNTFTSTAGLALSQNIGFTGGTISLGSDFQRTQNFLQKNSDFDTEFTTYPVRLSIIQPLNGYNKFHWDKKIEPLEYDAAKQTYVVAMEEVSSSAVINFFELAEWEARLKMAEANIKNAEELYNITHGRYNIGTVAEDELLRIELRKMEATSELNSSRIQIESRRNRLRSFLGFRDNVIIELLIDPETPDFQVPYEEALNLALTRNPNIISYNINIFQAEQEVAQAKSQNGITLDLNASFGTNKTGYSFKDAYATPFDDSEGIGLRITVPILDWSETKNRVRRAQSNLEVAEARVQQQETTFRQDIYLQVMSFNMQKGQLRIAEKSDTIAQKSYDISYQRYLAGKSNVTDLHTVDTAKDNAKIKYMQELRSFWNLYFTVRRLTLFDFQNKKPLEEDFEKIIGE